MRWLRPLLFALVVFAAFPAVADEVQQQLAILLRGPGPDAERAIERLRYLGPSRVGPRLRLLLQHHDAQARISASAALARVLDPGSAAALAQALSGDEDWEVRRNCADALGALDAKSQRKALSKQLRSDSNRRVRRSCATALGRMGGAGAELAKSASDDPDLEVRLAALDALSRSMDKAAARPLRKLLEDSSTMVRFGAARALAWQGDAAGRAFLDKSLKAADEESPRRAVTVLEDVPRKWAADLLAREAAGDGDLAYASARALTRREDPRGVASLARIEAAGGANASAAANVLDELGVDDQARKRLAGGTR